MQSFNKHRRSPYLGRIVSQVGIGAGGGSRETWEAMAAWPEDGPGGAQPCRRFEPFILGSRWRSPYPGKDTEPVAGPSKPREGENEGSGR